MDNREGLLTPDQDPAPTPRGEEKLTAGETVDAVRYMGARLVERAVAKIPGVSPFQRFVARFLLGGTSAMYSFEADMMPRTYGQDWEDAKRQARDQRTYSTV